jgi:hypothetical protein
VAETYCATAAALARLSLVILGNLAIYCKRPEAPERKDSSVRSRKKNKINRTLIFVFFALQNFPQVHRRQLREVVDQNFGTAGRCQNQKKNGIADNAVSF